MTGIQILKERRKNLIKQLRATDDVEMQRILKIEIDILEEKMCKTEPEEE